MTDVHDQPLLVTLKRACEMLAIAHSTIYRLIERGELQPVKIGRSTRFRYADILKLAEANDGPAAPKPAPVLPHLEKLLGPDGFYEEALQAIRQKARG